MPFSVTAGISSSSIPLKNEVTGDVTKIINMENVYYPVEFSIFPLATEHWRLGGGFSWVGNVRRKDFSTINKIAGELEPNIRNWYEKVYSYGVGGHAVAEFKTPLVGDSWRLLFWPRASFHYVTMLETEAEDIAMDNYSQDYWKLNLSIGFGYQIW